MNKVIYMKNGKKYEAYFSYCFDMPETKKTYFRIGNERFILNNEDIIKIEYYDYNSTKI